MYSYIVEYASVTKNNIVQHKIHSSNIVEEDAEERIEKTNIGDRVRCGTDCRSFVIVENINNEKIKRLMYFNYLTILRFIVSILFLNHFCICEKIFA